MRPRVFVVSSALLLFAVAACSRSQSVLPSGNLSSESRYPIRVDSAPSPCATFEPPIHSVSGVYDIPANASGSTAECAVNEALASGEEVIGYGDLPFFWQSVSALTAPIPISSARVSSPAEPAPFRYSKIVPPGAPRATVSNGMLPLSAIAAIRRTDGVVETFQGFADSTSILNGMLNQWQHTHAQTRLGAEAPAAKNLLVRDPKVWMELARAGNSVQINDDGRQSGTASTGFVIYRLNTGNKLYDTFLVTVEGNNSVTGFNGCVFNGGSGGRGYYCEWINAVGNGLRVNAYLSTPGNASAPLGKITDAQPKNATTSGTYEISEGADLTAEANCAVTDSAGLATNASSASSSSSCGVKIGGTYSTKVTQTWDVKSRTIVNYTAPQGATTGDWAMKFNGWNSDSCGKAGTLPADLKNAGDFGAAEIIRIPRNLIYTSSKPSLMLVGSYQGGTGAWYYLFSCSDLRESRAGNAVYQTFALPEFAVNRTAITIKAGGSDQFVITSKNPNLDAGLIPSLSLVGRGKVINPQSVGLDIAADNRSALAIKSKDEARMPLVQTWTITAASSATKGTYSLFLDTFPGGETDSTRSGPLEVTLTIN